MEFNCNILLSYYLLTIATNPFIVSNSSFSLNSKKKLIAVLSNVTDTLMNIPKMLRFNLLTYRLMSLIFLLSYICFRLSSCISRDLLMIRVNMYQIDNDTHTICGAANEQHVWARVNTSWQIQSLLMELQIISRFLIRNEYIYNDNERFLLTTRNSTRCFCSKFVYFISLIPFCMIRITLACA